MNAKDDMLHSSQNHQIIFHLSTELIKQNIMNSLISYQNPSDCTIIMAEESMTDACVPSIII